MLIRHLMLVVAVLVIPFQVQGQSPEPISRILPENVKVTRDIVYATYGDRSLRLDLYEPGQRDTTLLPSIVVIRGGGWRRGDKEKFGPMAAALAVRGLVAVSIEYRASKEAVFPAAVEDTKAAVRWLRANADRYRLNPDAIGAIGGSAGAHLAIYLGVTDRVTSLAGIGGNQDMASSVSAVIGLAPPTNLLSFTGHESDVEKNSYVVEFLGTSYKENPRLWTFASPISHVTASSPPLLLIHSESDRLVPFRQSLEITKLYGNIGVPVEVVLIPVAPHGFWNFKQWFGDTMDRSAAFFWRHLNNAE